MANAPHELTAGFDRAAERYDRGRPEYPPEAVSVLVKALGIGPGRTVLDLGAGTGKFTRALGGLGATLLALEPTAGMRQILKARFPQIPLIQGTAEEIRLPDSSVDAVVCAQSFHWFDTVRASAEIARVLRPGGGLGLVWNLRDEAVPWVAELSRILDARDPGAPRGRDMAWRPAFEATGRFSPLQEAEVRFVQKADLDTMIDRVLSVSFIAVRSAEEQEEVGQEVRALIEREPSARVGGGVQLPYRTHVLWALRR